jgi:hypothetical protein
MKQNFALLVLLLASLACSIVTSAKPAPEPPPIPVEQPPTALVPPSQTPGNLTPETPALNETEASAPETFLEHRWAARGFAKPETVADPDLADGEPDVTNCADPFLPASSDPAILTLTYTASLIADGSEENSRLTAFLVEAEP